MTNNNENTYPAQVQLISEKSIASYKEKDKNYSIENFPYFGYYSVNLFQCPEFTMFTNNDCPRAVDILFHKNFEPMSIKVWSHFVLKSKLAIDIGAHVGIFSLVAAAINKNIEIHAFEPNPDVFSRLQIHRNINKFYNIKLYRNAFAHKDGLTELNWLKKYNNGWLSSGSTILKGIPKELTDSAIANVFKFDTFYKNNPIKEPFIIKIDIEGAEELLIDGMGETIKNKPDIILETFSEKAAKKLTNIAKNLGYSFFLIDELKMKIHKLESLIACDPTKTNFNQILTTKPDTLNCFL